MKTKALFLDRDGIINVDHGYVHRIDDFQFIEDIFSLVRIFFDAGYLIFVVTNQSGIGRGYYSESDFNKLISWMKKEFKAQGTPIKEVYYCPHTPEEKCSCRKPKTGMIEQALKNYNIDLPRSWMIGDKQSDIDLAKNAGIGHSIAIGNTNNRDADHFFPSVKECKRFLEENPDIITP